MGNYAYILVAALIATTGAFLLSQRKDTRSSEVDLGRIQMKEEARNAAGTGLSITMRKLAQDQDPWLVPANYETGPYAYGDPPATYQTVVTIVDSVGGDTLDVVATGTKVYKTRSGSVRDTTHVIEVRIARGVLNNQIPPAFRSAILSDNRLRIHGDFNVNALLDGVNADIHTNGILDIAGNSFQVQGMGTYTNGVNINSQQMDNFVPDVDWNGSDDNVFQRDSIPLPKWNADTFRDSAQVQGYYTSDPMVVDGDAIAALGITSIDQYAEQVLGLPPGDYGVSEDAPFLIMVDNTLTFDNAVHLSGFVNWGTTGNIDVQTHGSTDGVFFDYTADLDNKTAYTHAGIFTTAAIRVEGNAEIHGTLYSEGSITYLGGTHLIGGQVAKDTSFQGGGTVDVDWVGPGSGVVDTFGGYDEPIGPVIIAYSEW